MCNFDEHLLKICTVANSPQGFAGYAKYPIAPTWTCRCLEFDLSSLLYCWITCPRLYVPYLIKTHTNRYDVSEEKGYKWIDGRPRIHHGKFNLSNLPVAHQGNTGLFEEICGGSLSILDTCVGKEKATARDATESRRRRKCGTLLNPSTVRSWA